MAKLIARSNLRWPLETVLADRGLLSGPDLQAALARAQAHGVALAQQLVDDNVLPEDAVYSALADAFGLPFESLAEPPRLSLADVKEQVRRHCQVNHLLPIALDQSQLSLATALPENQHRYQGLLAGLGYTLRFVVVPPSRLAALLAQQLQADHDQAAPLTAQFHELTEGMADLADPGGGAVSGSLLDISDDTSDAAVVNLVNKVMGTAIREGASDIHLETLDDARLGIRCRVDGVLVPMATAPVAVASAVVSRVMVMAELDITERLLPQDGAIRVTFESREVEFRVGCIPCIHGQNLTLRILQDRSREVAQLEGLGLRADELAILQTNMQFPHGMMLVSGPTGSGKSTTLYAVLRQLAVPSVKIITVEDPVERKISGVQQVQVKVNRNDPERSLTFARGLRSILRLDPDIIMVGEIRDRETADIAVQASLTGHLVLSTVHANSALETLRRMVNMGVDPDLMVSSLNLIVAQRLVRRLCGACALEHETTPQELLQLAVVGKNPPRVKKAQGCARCFRSGYRGRQGVFEMLPITRTVREQLRRNVSLETIGDEMAQGGFRNLRGSGLLGVAEGFTDFAEVLRVCGP